MWSLIIHSTQCMMRTNGTCPSVEITKVKNMLFCKLLHSVEEEWGTKTGTWSHIAMMEICISHLPT
jgi:hypothetical protein